MVTRIPYDIIEESPNIFEEIHWLSERNFVVWERFFWKTNLDGAICIETWKIQEKTLVKQQIALEKVRPENSANIGVKNFAGQKEC